LLIRTGRRPAEICHLRTTCLQWDERVRDDGTLDRQPVLVYRPEKTPKRSKRLPVHAREALIINRAGEAPEHGSRTSRRRSCRCSRARPRTGPELFR
jgi:integrase